MSPNQIPLILKVMGAVGLPYFGWQWLKAIKELTEGKVTAWNDLHSVWRGEAADVIHDREDDPEYFWLLTVQKIAVLSGFVFGCSLVLLKL